MLIWQKKKLLGSQVEYEKHVVKAQCVDCCDTMLKDVNEGRTVCALASNGIANARLQQA